MGYKITNSSSSFVDITLSETLKHNRSLQNMDKLNKSIDCAKIKSILSCHYTHGTSNARLVKSASFPVSSDQVKKNKENKHIKKTN